MNNKVEVSWGDKYRPKTIKETILPKSIKKVLQQFVDEGNVPLHLILNGHTGVGKTTSAKAMLDEIGCEYIVINGSLENNIDTLRTKIKNYASTKSLRGGRKYVIIDEGDHLNPNSFQPALRNFVDTYEKNCGFIITSNYKMKLMKEVRSRFTVIDFVIPKEEKKSLAVQFFKRVTKILDDQEIEYNKKIVSALIMKHYPNWRKIINAIQFNSKSGTLSENVLSKEDSEAFGELFDSIKKKSFDNMRKWVEENDQISTEDFYDSLYDFCVGSISSKTELAGAIVLVAEYMYKEAFAANLKVNRAACVLSLSHEITEFR